MTAVRVLTATDIVQLMSHVGVHSFMDALIDRLQVAFAEYSNGRFRVPARDGFHYNAGLVEWMPLMQHDAAVLMKMVGYHPTNPAQRGLPTVVSTLSMFDTRTGQLTAFADGRLLTAMRTGAASAVATRLLSPPDVSSLGLIGCGTQAVTQLHALSRIRNFSKVRFCDTNVAVADTLRERVSCLVDDKVQLMPCEIEEVVERSDVICTATSVDVGGGPVFRTPLNTVCLHVNAVGSDLPGKTELPPEFLRTAVVCPDFRPQAVAEGECQQLSDEEIGPDIMEIAGRLVESRKLCDRLTVFDST
ncbi:MAG: ornithine cyclodeaminase family protein, partial [Planctomycetaceae bacterium]|nr:ornithine cyclodeaminase family protein [Planctomycetaceae bacterium]